MKNRILLGCAVFGASLLVLAWGRWYPPPPPSASFANLLTRLEWECDAGNPGSDYQWSTSAMPTETNRAHLIEEAKRDASGMLQGIRAELRHRADDETREMLVIIAAALGDQDSLLPAAKLMVWADSPAVRLAAATELRRLQDLRTVEWFQQALADERFVHNSDCQQGVENFYPIRMIAHIALTEMNCQTNER